MRILHVTDLHFNVHWFEWVAANATTFDCVCIPGDLLDMSPIAKAPIKKQVPWILDWVRNFPAVPLFLCSGNHDWWTKGDLEYPDEFAEAAWMLCARRRGVTVDGGIQIFSGFRFICHAWLSQLIVEPSPEPVVLLAHAPPERAPVAHECGNDVGDFELTETIPLLPPGSIVLSGHAHNPARHWARMGATTCFNPGVGDARTAMPNHVIIDTQTRVADFTGWSKPTIRTKLY